MYSGGNRHPYWECLKRRWIIHFAIGTFPRKTSEEEFIANRTLSMQKIKEILRLKWKQGCINRQIVKSGNISRSKVTEYFRHAQGACLTVSWSSIGWCSPWELVISCTTHISLNYNTATSFMKKSLPKLQIPAMLLSILNFYNCWISSSYPKRETRWEKSLSWQDIATWATYLSAF